MEMEKIDWCECKEKTEEKAAQPRETKAQQSGAWTGDLESAAKRRMDRRPGKRSQRERYPKRGQENLQNTKRSVVEYWDRKNRHS